MSKVWNFIKAGFKTLFWDDIREGFVDLRPVGWDTRLLVVVAFAVMLMMMAATLLFDQGRTLVGPITFETAGDAPQTFSISLVALALTTVVSALGWAYVMIGAARCKWWVFLLIGVLFAFNVFVLAPTTSVLPLMYVCSMIVVAVISLGFYFVLQRVQRRAWMGFLEAGWWIGLSFFFLAITWLGEENSALIAQAFYAGTSIVYIIATIYWIYMALSVIDLSMSVARWLVSGARMVLPSGPTRWPILAFILLKPLISLALFSFFSSDMLALDIFASAALAVVALVLLPLRRYSPTTAYVLLALSITLTIASYGMVLALEENDFNSLILEKLGIASSLLVFVVLTLWDMASSGARFANANGKILPREGRMLLYSGGLMLAAMATLFYTAVFDPNAVEQASRFQNAANGALAFGVDILGLPYLLFNLWKHRKKLIGPPVEEGGGWGRLRQLPGGTWIILAVVLGVMGCCLAVVVLSAGAMLNY